MLAYCDYIADCTKTALFLDSLSRDSYVKHVGPMKFDLHPEGGYMLSTKKTIEVTDVNGKSYIITVEEK